MRVLHCRGKHYRDVNALVEAWWREGCRHIVLEGVCGHRYLGRVLEGEGRIDIRGVPGDDLGMFLDGPSLWVFGNAQDGVGNTMNRGKIVVQGDARDILGLSMRGGKIWVRGNVGYRVGIHMKSYEDEYPVIVIGGATGDFLGEYMAGGLIAVLGLWTPEGRSPVGHFVASGMHGGKIFVRGAVAPSQVGAGIGLDVPTEEEFSELERYLEEFAADLAVSLPSLDRQDFVKIFPQTTRPYGRLYAY
jgi:glutamate synthase domain-containing protein 3